MVVTVAVGPLVVGPEARPGCPQQLSVPQAAGEACLGSAGVAHLWEGEAEDGGKQPREQLLAPSACGLIQRIRTGPS